MYAEVGSVIRFSTTTWLVHALEMSKVYEHKKTLESHSREPHAANSVLLKFICRTLSVHLIPWSSRGQPERCCFAVKGWDNRRRHLPSPEMEPELEAVETGRGGKTGEVGWSDRSSISECG